MPMTLGLYFFFFLAFLTCLFWILNNNSIFYYYYFLLHFFVKLKGLRVSVRVTEVHDGQKRTDTCGE